MAASGFALVTFGAIWLAFIGVLCVLRPDLARRGLASMGSTWPIQIGEHLLRGLFGLGLILAAPISRFPLAFEVAGWFIVATSALILMAPKRWHHAYAIWWAERIPIWAYRIAALPTFAAAAMLIYALS